jgi:hypothetical protein
MRMTGIARIAQRQVPVDDRVYTTRYFKCLRHMTTVVVKVGVPEGVTSTFPIPKCPVMQCDMEETK